MYILEDKLVDKEDILFKVMKPGRRGWLKIIGISLLLNVFWLFGGLTGLAIFLVPIISYFSVRSWNRLGPRIIRKYIIENFEELQKIKENPDYESQKSLYYRIFENLLGLNLNPNDSYFVEGRIIDLDLSNPSTILKSRFIEVVVAALGIVVIIGSTLNNTILAGDNPPEELVNLTIVLLIIAIEISPIFVSIIIPATWTMRDARIKVINKEYHEDDFFEFIRRGLLSRFLSITGIFGGISFTANFTLKVSGNDNLTLVGAYIFAVLFLIVIFFSMAGTLYFVASLYLNTKHEQLVNETRLAISQYVPVGLTSVRVLSEEESKHILDVTPQILPDYIFKRQMNPVDVGDDPQLNNLPENLEEQN